MRVFSATVSNIPTGGLLPAPYLPEMWMRVAYISAIAIVVAWIIVHAWMWLHQRRHGCPPYLVLWLHKWWTGTKPGKRMIGMGRREC